MNCWSCLHWIKVDGESGLCRKLYAAENILHEVSDSDLLGYEEAIKAKMAGFPVLETQSDFSCVHHDFADARAQEGMSRVDEEGNPCPGTFGEYRDLIVALVGEENEAVAYLDERIAELGRNAKVVAEDEDMRDLLQPMMVQKKKKPANIQAFKKDESDEES